jgi:hypothetical protein
VNSNYFKSSQWQTITSPIVHIVYKPLPDGFVHGIPLTQIYHLASLRAIYPGFPLSNKSLIKDVVVAPDVGSELFALLFLP